MRLTAMWCRFMPRIMENELTPEQVEAAAVKARVPLTTFIRQAGVNPATFYRWKRDAELRPLTLAKLVDAVRDVA